MEIYITRQVFQEIRRLRIGRRHIGTTGMDGERCVDTYMLEDGRSIVHDFSWHDETFLLRPARPSRER